MRLGEIIRQFREKEGISQREFARRCELSNSLISILEMGVNPQTGKPMEPDMRTYRRLAAGMGISVRQLDDMLRLSGSDSGKTLSGLSADDIRILEAFHQNPSLRALFDISQKVKPEDIDKMTQWFKLIEDRRNGE